MTVTPWLIFLIIFFWTPPHFWSLALKFKDDYKRAELPMLPNRYGDTYTLNSIFCYTLILFLVSLFPLFINFSWLYLITALIFGGLFIYKSALIRIKNINKSILIINK